MLVLTRKNRESVLVGGGGGFEHTLKVTVLEIQGSKVRLGFEADASVPIHRAEVWERLRTVERVNGDVDEIDRTMPAAVVPFA